MDFVCRREELDYLRERDKQLGEAIDRIGAIRRKMNPDPFCFLVESIIGQQISSAAQNTICARLAEQVGTVTPASIAAIPPAELQSIGISHRKAGYIADFAGAVQAGTLDPEGLRALPDEEVVAVLCALRGIGRWTAEMLLLFCFGRRDVLSYGDLAIHRGMRMLYRHRQVTPALFEKYRRRYSPHGSAASLYLWAIAGGALPDLRDHAPKRRPAAKRKAARTGGATPAKTN